MAEVSPPLFLDVDGVYGADELGLPHRDLIGEGVLSYSDLRVSQRGAGANMTVDVSAGACWIMGDTTPAAQPQYRCRNDAVVNLAIGTAHATLPRIDTVVAEVLDATFTGSSNLWRLRVIPGTATGGATLDNRTGAAALPDTAILLADVLVAAADTSISDSEIRDRRPFGAPGTIPPLITKADMVQFQPPPGLLLGMGINYGTTSTHQNAALMYLPRRIVGATRLRWSYVTAGSPGTPGYVLGIYDASGRKIVDTGTLTQGAPSSWLHRADVIAATTFEAGFYYVFMGCQWSVMNSMSFVGWAAPTNVTNAPNIYLYSLTGGVTPPATLLGMTDTFSLAAGPPWAGGVPLLALSVG